MSVVRGRPWALLFLVSLALNLFLGGMLTARWLHHPRFKGPQSPFGMLGREELPAARRVWKRHQPDWEPKLAALAEAKKRAADALTADPFDAQSAARSLEELRIASSGVQQSFHAALVELAGELPVAQRRNLRHALDFHRRSVGHSRPRWGGGAPNDESFPSNDPSASPPIPSDSAR